jgi:hypothetical protein
MRNSAEEAKVSLRILRVEVTPNSGEIRVSYVVGLENKTFTGEIGGGETSFAHEVLGPQLFELVSKVEAQICQDLGLGPPQEEQVLAYDDEDPL